MSFFQKSGNPQLPEYSLATRAVQRHSSNVTFSISKTCYFQKHHCGASTPSHPGACESDQKSADWFGGGLEVRKGFRNLRRPHVEDLDLYDLYDLLWVQGCSRNSPVNDNNESVLIKTCQTGPRLVTVALQGTPAQCRLTRSSTTSLLGVSASLGTCISCGQEGIRCHGAGAMWAMSFVQGKSWLVSKTDRNGQQWSSVANNGLWLSTIVW